MNRLLLTIALAATLLWPTAARADDGRVANVSAYCIEGITASGAWTRWGTAAGAGWIPLGSLVWVERYGLVLITDRGQPGLFDIDLAAPGDCDWAWNYGRQYLSIRIVRWGWLWN